MVSECRKFKINGAWHSFILEYRSESPLRSEAIEFFKNVRFRLGWTAVLPEECKVMTPSDIQLYFDLHGAERRIYTLTIGESDVISDEDFGYLKFIPEL